MTREILCPDCRKQTRKMFPTNNPYPNEHIKLVDGEAKDNFVCDHCNTPILIGMDCTAFSIWSTMRGGYFPWEHDFIQPKMEK